MNLYQHRLGIIILFVCHKELNVRLVFSKMCTSVWESVKSFIYIYLNVPCTSSGTVGWRVSSVRLHHKPSLGWLFSLAEQCSAPSVLLVQFVFCVTNYTLLCNLFFFCANTFVFSIVFFSFKVLYWSLFACFMLLPMYIAICVIPVQQSTLHLVQVCRLKLDPLALL